MLIIFGFFVMLLMFFLVGRISGMLWVFVNLPSIILITIPMIYFLIVSKNGNIIGKYLKSSFKKADEYTKNELDCLSAVMKNTIKFTLTIGFFYFIAGLIASIGYIGLPARLGPSLAISLCTLVYSVAISGFVFFPVQAWAENRKNALLLQEG